MIEAARDYDEGWDMKYTLAKAIVSDVLVNLSGRSGLDAALNDIDFQTSMEMHRDLIELVEARIVKYVPEVEGADN